MNGYALAGAEMPSIKFADELIFLRQHTGQDEAALLIEALQAGLNVIYQRTVEQLFIDEQLSRQEAASILGEERVAHLEYARQALSQDILHGFQL